jgi:MYXO-CTERM domain-containing protein
VTRFAALLTSMLVVAASTGVSAQTVHEADLAAHRGEAPAVRTAPSAERLRAGQRKAVERVVYGYYPYWVADLDAIRWEALTHLAWFAIEIDATGAVTARHGWPDATTVAAAHAADVRVDLTFTLFSGSGIRALCTDPERRAATIATMIDELEAGDADGISVDFEGLIDGTREAFTTFMRELRAGLDARGHTDAETSIAGPSVNWAGSDGVPEFDLPALLEVTDYVFIMGYGYFWGGSTHAGGIGIQRLSALWRDVQSWSMERTIAGFASEVGAAHRHQIIHGVPYYGREWVTADDGVAATTVGHIGAVTYSAAMADLGGGQTRVWDEGSRQPWYRWQAADGWHQVWYDDEQSLGEKYRFIVEQDLGGVGIWALNYDQGHQALWDQLEASLGAETPVAGDRRAPLPVDVAAFHDERSTADAPGNYFDYYACAPDSPEYGREWVYRIDLCAATHLDATVEVDAGADVDLHLLSDLDEAACVARDDAALSLELEPGTYYLVADTFVRDLVTAEGAFRLDVTVGADALCVEPGGDAGLAHDQLEGGCCSSGGSPAGAAPLALLVALGLRRRRRSTRR